MTNSKNRVNFLANGRFFVPQTPFMTKIKAFLSKFFPKNRESNSGNHHDHQWELLLRTYCPPTNINITNTTEALAEKTIFGFTTLLWECLVGHETRKEEILGTEPLQIDELVFKVDHLGTQYFQKGSSTYAIGKIHAQSGVVPVK